MGRGGTTQPIHGELVLGAGRTELGFRPRWSSPLGSAWDIPYYSEKLRQKKYSISQEELKPYFPESKVVPGMFAVVHRLYGLNISETKNIDTWHKDVRFFEIMDAKGELRGQFYLDLYARPHKRGGAWMDECITRKHARHNF